MTDEVKESSRLRDRTLARWENEGGAKGQAWTSADCPVDGPPVVPAFTNAELSQLHIRVIALEGLVTALLADATDRQKTLVREMAGFMLPRAGATEHPLSVRAANQLVDLLQRAERFRESGPDTHSS